MEDKQHFDDATCTHCGAQDYEPVHPFDYVKVCNECGEQFSASPHN